MNKNGLIKIIVMVSCLFTVVGVIGTTGEAGAVAGAQSSATLTLTSMTAAPPYQMPTLNAMSTEAIATSTSPGTFIIDSVSTPRWEDVQVTTSISDSAYNVSLTNADAAGQSVSQLALAAADRSGQYMADAQALHDVNFFATGDATLTVSAAYDILLQVFKDNPSESASGYYLAGLYLWNLTQNTESLVEVTDTFTYAAGADPAAIYAQFSDTLVSSLAFAAGDAGAFRIIVDGHAEAYSVPEPSTFALLGIGLLGAGLVRRRTRH